MKSVHLLLTTSLFLVLISCSSKGPSVQHHSPTHHQTSDHHPNPNQRYNQKPSPIPE